MEHTVGEVARLAGVTVRTLHHYDDIGLLEPSSRTPAGYRCYTHADLERLQRILFYRELDFGLDEIAALLAEDADPMEHLRRQHGLLTERIARLQQLAATVTRTMEALTMGINLTPQEMLEVFGDHDPTEHHAEAEQRWGDTDAWRESQRRSASYGKQQWAEIKAEGEAIQQRLGHAMRSGASPDSGEAMDAAEAHRQHIGRWFYDCSPAMHRGLGELYVEDERFRNNYDTVVPGLAAWVRDAVRANADRQEGGGAG